MTRSPATGSQRSENRYEHTLPGSMINADVKKLGKIPQGGGRRLHDRDGAVSVANRHKNPKIGYDFTHTAIDDHTCPAYA